MYDDGIIWTRLPHIACGKCRTVIDVSESEPFSLIHCPACGTQQSVPVQLGAFLLVERLGAGGMGAVYRGMDPALGRFVAIKVMKRELGDDPELVERFLREARAAAALNHPNIVQIYSCGQEAGQPYIVMELVSGGRLDQMMEGGKKVDEARLLEISLDVAEGLKAANEAGLVHGDIKPANILLDKSGRARIVDFGLATFVDRQQEQSGVWGTPYYISPERVRGGKADHRSDIYSLGATMFHALAGQPPFEGKTATEVVVARLKRPPPNIREIDPNITPETAELIERMMAPDPVLRYPTSASLLADMRRALAAAKAKKSATTAKKKKREYSHYIVLGVAAAVVLIIAVVAFKWFEKASKEVPPAVATKRPPGPAGQPSASPSASQKTEGEQKTTRPAAGEDSEGVVIQRTEGGRVRMTIVFFEGELEAALIRACTNLSVNPAKMAEEVAAMATNVPPNSARMMWLRLLEALPRWVQGDAAKADELLRQVAALPLTQRRGHPVYMPQTLALYLIGDLNEERFAKERREWPVWYGDLSGFFAGVRRLFAGEPERAVQAFETYVNTERNEPAWVYALRPAAREWLKALERWEDIERDTVARAAGGDVNGARAALDQYASQAASFMRPAIARLRERIAAIEEEQRAARLEEERRARRVFVQRDFDALTEWLSEQTTAIVQQKEFRRLAQAARELAGRMTTEEGKAQAAIVREHFERLHSLRDLMTRELSSNPFKGPDRELGGEAVGATALGIRVNTPGKGITTRPWDQVSPRLFVLLGRHLAENVYRPDDAKADLYLTLAVASAYFGAHEPAAEFFRQALAISPSLGATAHRLLPGAPPAAPATAE